ncbi:nucleotidyl transferase AbiEii/AbiGii toxin family protein [Rhizobium favelukesii]|nr:nucleotidyl transferase AbiEii/AbiGii toxin family protein [Rhizobium favelukesii]
MTPFALPGFCRTRTTPAVISQRPSRAFIASEHATMFGFAEIQVVSFADLYAGKIMAALVRQHPRDLFDIRDLLAAEGISEAIRQAFCRLSDQPRQAHC